MSADEEFTEAFEESFEGSAGESTEGETSSESSTNVVLDALEVTLQMVDLWDSVLEGKIPLDEFVQTMNALQSAVSSTRGRRRRRR
jgi:hypothetical protein